MEKKFNFFPKPLQNVEGEGSILSHEGDIYILGVLT